jgi:nucleoside phosphorylase
MSLTQGAVLFALDREMASMRRLYPQRVVIASPPGVRAWRCTGPLGTHDLIRFGMGARAAETVCDWLLPQRPPLVLLTGFSGGLAPDLKVGDVVVADRVRDLAGWDHPVSLSIPIPGTRVGAILTTSEMVSRPEQKGNLHQQTGALAVDMESAAIALCCGGAGIPFAVVRVISDDARMCLPPELPHLLDGERLLVGAFLRALLRRPRLLGELLTLARTTRHAATALCQALQAGFRYLPG